MAQQAAAARSFGLQALVCPLRLPRVQSLGLFVLFALSSPGCVLLPGLESPARPLPDTQVLARTVERLTPPRMLVLHGAIHCHGRWSHDAAASSVRIARQAHRVGLDFVCMTDHWRPNVELLGARGPQGEVIFFHGVELRASGGSVLGLDTNLPLPRRRHPKTEADPFERVERAGGLALIAHAESFRAWETGARLADGLEIANLHAAALAHSRAALLFAALFRPPASFFRWLARGLDRNVLTHWDRIGLRRRLPGWGGADAHENIRLLGPYGATISTYAQTFRAISNYVLASGANADAIREALAAGRGWVAFETLGSARAFRFALTDARGHVVAAPGAEVQLHPELYLEAVCPGGAELRVLRNGRVIARANSKVRLPLERPGVYRVEAWLARDPFVLANPIYVRPAAPTR